MPAEYPSNPHLDSRCILHFWHLVLHRSSISTHNSYQRIQLGSFDLFLYNHNGSIACYVNSCPHRASRLISSVSGCQPLRCPYHGWSFRPDGTSIPSYSTFSPEQDPRAARLEEWLTYELNGFIFISLKPHSSVYDQIGQHSYQMLMDIGKSISALHSLSTIRFDSPWTLAVENALEPYHLTSVHSDTLALLGLDSGTNKLDTWSSLWTASTHKHKLINTFDILRSRISAPFHLNGYFSLYLFPFSMLSSTAALSFSLQVYQPSPRSANPFTTMLTSLYKPAITNDRYLQMAEGYFTGIAKMNDRIFTEDASIVSLVHADSWSPEPLRYCSELEHKINHFRTCCRNLLNEPPHASISLTV